MKKLDAKKKKKGSAGNSEWGGCGANLLVKKDRCPPLQIHLVGMGLHICSYESDIEDAGCYQFELYVETVIIFRESAWKLQRVPAKFNRKYKYQDPNSKTRQM